MEKIRNIENVSLAKKLEGLGIEESVLRNYKKIIENIDFINIDLESESGKIHIKMVAALFSRADNERPFLKNIISNINLKNIDRIEVSGRFNPEEEGDVATEQEDITNLDDLVMDNIDLDIGTNRRVNNITCYLKDGSEMSFTLSADFVSGDNDLNSNSYQEREVFESDFAKDNPILQRYYGYLKREFSGKDQRFIAKEYLPGKNIEQYLRELENNKESLSDFMDISSSLAYSMSELYKRGQGTLLADLKIENIIYNHEQQDNLEYPCRVCDNSGFYSDEAEKKSALQVLAHIQSLLTILNNKIRLILKSNNGRKIMQ